MTKWQKMQQEGAGIVRHYRKEVEFAARKGYVEMYKGCKDRLWGACAMAVVMGIMTRSEQEALDVWAEEVWTFELRLRCNQSNTQEEETPCRGITETVTSGPERIPS